MFHSGIGEPDAIVRPESVAEVQAAVRWAAASVVAIMVRGGGHSAWGGVPGGLTIDLATTSTSSGWVSKMYPPATLARLTELKRAWDPSNRFSRNHNVVPD